MKILVACEESQAVTIELRKLGHEAYSCDIEPCSGGHPEWHLQTDVIPLLKEKWDMIIAHPPCTRLCSSGQRWLYFGSEEYREQKRKDQADGIRFFMMFTDLDCPRVAIENPVGIMSTYYRKPDQIYNPYDFTGETECKNTCLWLKGLPPLKATQTLPKNERTQNIWKAHFDGKAYAWTDREVAKMRSKTPAGVARAMAEQWAGECL